MRRLGWGVLTGVLVVGAAPLAANTIMEENTYYEFSFGSAPLIDYTEWDFYYTNPRAISSEGFVGPFTLGINVEGIWLDPLRGQTLVFDQPWGGNNWSAEVGGVEVDVFLSHDGYDARGSITFDEFQNVIGWNILTGDFHAGDVCSISGGRNEEGEFSGNLNCDDNYTETNRTGKFYGQWNLEREWAVRAFYQDGDDTVTAIDIPRPGGGVITPGGPGDQGGGGGLPGPIPLPPSPIPLPASVLLLLSGLGALGAGGLWRRRSAA